MYRVVTVTCVFTKTRKIISDNSTVFKGQSCVSKKVIIMYGSTYVKLYEQKTFLQTLPSVILL